MLPDRGQPRIRQSDRVEHSTAELGYPWRAVAVARFYRDGLGHQSTKALQVHDARELPTEAGGAGNEEDGILEGAAEDGSGEA
jgi:hypothetical protein